MGKRGGRDSSRIVSRVSNAEIDALYELHKEFAEDSDGRSPPEIAAKYITQSKTIKEYSKFEQLSILKYYTDRLAQGKVLDTDISHDLDEYFKQTGTLPYETRAFFDKNGKPILIKKGAESEVFLVTDESDYVHEKGGYDSTSIDAHNHPGGNVASPEDIYSMKGSYQKMAVNTNRQIFIYIIPQNIRKNEEEMERIGDIYQDVFENNFHKGKVWNTVEADLGLIGDSHRDAYEWARTTDQHYGIVKELRNYLNINELKIEVIDKNKYTMSDYLKGKIPAKDLKLPSQKKQAEYIIQTLKKEYNLTSYSDRRAMITTNAEKLKAYPKDVVYRALFKSLDMSNATKEEALKDKMWATHNPVDAKKIQTIIKEAEKNDILFDLAAILPRPSKKPSKPSPFFDKVGKDIMGTDTKKRKK